jgi:hypothetical protein
LTAKVGFLFISFYEEFFCASVEFPVDMTNGFASVIEAMFGKFYRKTVVGTLV